MRRTNQHTSMIIQTKTAYYTTNKCDAECRMSSVQPALAARMPCDQSKGATHFLGTHLCTQFISVVDDRNSLLHLQSMVCGTDFRNLSWPHWQFMGNLKPFHQGRSGGVSLCDVENSNKSTSFANKQAGKAWEALHFPDSLHELLGPSPSRAEENGPFCSGRAHRKIPALRNLRAQA